MKVEKIQRHTLKVLSILIAVTLWFFVLNSEPIEIEKKLPINYIIPKGMVMVSFSEREVTLKLKGSKAFVRNIFTKKEKYNVDVTPYYQSTGKNFKVKFYTTAIEVPFGVEILEVSPKETVVELDQKGLTELPVKIQFFGETPKDRKIKDLKLTPDSLMVSGPMEMLKRISRLDTAPVNLSLLNKDEGSLTLQLAPVDPRFKIEENEKIKLYFRTRKIY